MNFAKKIFALICDDIRQEVGNKVSLMGVYGKDVIVPDIPYVFPKICLWLVIEEAKIEIHNLKIVVTAPQSDPITIDLPAPPNQKTPQDIRIGMTIAPLKVFAEGKVKIQISKGNDLKPFVSHQFEIKKSKNIITPSVNPGPV